MTENDKSDHWRLLAAELGAEVPAEEESPPKVEVEGVAPSPSEPSGPSPEIVGDEDRPGAALAAPAPRRPAPPRRTASDWNRLAEELGVAVPLEPEAPKTFPEEPALQPAEVEPEDLRPSESRLGRRTEPEAERELEEPLRPAAEPSRGDDRRGRKRRRRRRLSGGPERERPAPAGESSQAPERGVSGEDREPEDLGSEEVEPVSTPSAAERGEEDLRRGKRRRRRRGASSRRESPAGAEAEVRRDRGESTLAPSLERSDQDESDSAIVEDDAVDDELLDEERPAEGGSRGEKALHRAIPSWFDAVNVVISANLESRAKNPDRRPGNRPRGGQERRGRERSGDKPS